MKITEKELLSLTRKHQIDVLVEQGRLKKSSIPYTPPEAMPDINSSQVLGLLRAVVEILNRKE